MKINILILVTEAIGGGVERLIYDQMRFYDAKKFNLHVITFRKGYLDKEFSETSAHYTCLNVKNRLSYKIYKQLINYLRSNHIDIVHTHLYLPDFYGFLIKMAVPRIKLFTTKHNTNQFRKKFFWGWLDNLLSFPSASIIAVSNSVKKFISTYEHINPSRIKVIYHGVDTTRFTKAIKPDKLRTKLGIRKNDFVVGIVGRITKQKGHEYLIKAVSALKNSIPSVVILVIGTGELQPSLMNLCQKLNIMKHVKFLGHRKDVPELYRIMNVLCLPSIYEGLGLVLVEAMLSGTIAVGADVDGIREIIEDGITGFLIPPRDSQSMSNILYQIFMSQYDKKMLIRAKETAKKFNYRKNLRNIELEYLHA